MSARSSLVDTSFLYALYNAKDVNHTTAIAYMKANSFLPLIPDIILPEVAFLFNRDVGPEGTTRFLRVFASTQPHLIILTPADLNRMAEIMEAYPKAKFDLVDCGIMALAERYGIEQVLTFDRRDFGIFRPRHRDHFTLLP
jgi:predicted nucleic acid-binding protein